MAVTAKHAAASCPRCGAAFCAEYVLLDGTARWSCSCGAAGPLTGSLSIRSKAATAPAAAKPEQVPHRHWRDVARG